MKKAATASVASGGITSTEAAALLKGDSEDLRQHKEKKAQEKQRKAEPKAPKGRTKSKFKFSKKGLEDIKEKPSVIFGNKKNKK